MDAGKTDTPMSDYDLFPRAIQELLVDVDLDRLGEEAVARVSNRLVRSNVAPQVVDVPLAKVLPAVRVELPTERTDIALPSELPVIVAARFMQHRNADTALVIVADQRHLVSRDKLLALMEEMGYTFSSRAARAIQHTLQPKGPEIATFFLHVYNRAGDAECRRQICYQCAIDPTHVFPGGKGRIECAYGDYSGHVHARVRALADTTPCCG